MKFKKCSFRYEIRTNYKSRKYLKWRGRGNFCDVHLSLRRAQDMLSESNCIRANSARWNFDAYHLYMCTVCVPYIRVHSLKYYMGTPKTTKKNYVYSVSFRHKNSLVWLYGLIIYGQQKAHWEKMICTSEFQIAIVQILMLMQIENKYRFFSEIYLCKKKILRHFPWIYWITKRT